MTEPAEGHSDEIDTAEAIAGPSSVAERSRAFWAWYNGHDSAPARSPDAVPRVRGSRYLGYTITGSGRRRAPTGSVRREILSGQRGRCLYCESRFGSTVMRRGRPVVLQLNWDHFIPYAYGMTNPGGNWVAACHVCNQIKSARMFDTVMKAQAYILERWADKGYEKQPLLSTPSPRDLE